MTVEFEERVCEALEKIAHLLELLVNSEMSGPELEGKKDNRGDRLYVS